MKNLMMLLLAVEVSFFQPKAVSAQRLHAEALAGSRNYWYQHTFSGTLNESSRLGLFHVTSFLVYYHPKLYEIMSQSHITYKVLGGWKAGVGTYFIPSKGLVPSFSSQYVFVKDCWSVVLSPRTDLWKNPSFELFAQFEWNQKSGWYFRFQAMESISRSGHMRGYQLVRIGRRRKNVIGGIGVNADYYTNHLTYLNAGIFLRSGFD